MVIRCLALLVLVCCYSCVSGEDPEVNYDAVSRVFCSDRERIIIYHALLTAQIRKYLLYSRLPTRIKQQKTQLVAS